MVITTLRFGDEEPPRRHYAANVGNCARGRGRQKEEIAAAAAAAVASA